MNAHSPRFILKQYPEGNFFKLQLLHKLQVKQLPVQKVDFIVAMLRLAVFLPRWISILVDRQFVYLLWVFVCPNEFAVTELSIVPMPEMNFHLFAVISKVCYQSCN